MNNVKKTQILEKFVSRLSEYDWTTTNGTDFNYQNDKLRFRLSSYSLSIDYIESDGKKQTGFQFGSSEYKGIRQLYMNMCDDALENALEEILNAEPDIKRELGLEELLDA